MSRTTAKAPMLTLRAIVILALALLPAVGVGGVTYLSIPPSPLTLLFALFVGLGAWLAAAAALDQLVE